MSHLTVYRHRVPQVEASDIAAIAALLKPLGIEIARWDLKNVDGLSDAEILEAYATEIETIKAQYGFQQVDIVHLTPDHPQRAVFREKFLDEHTHSDFEVRFFVRGQGLFYFHPETEDGATVYSLLCTAGDFISVPAGTRHWFDMGSVPDFSAIRFFSTPEGWVAQFTGSTIAREHPLLP